MSLKSQKHVTKSSLFPVSFDSSTTLNMGEVIPSAILEVTPKSHVKAHIGSAARLAPMVNPTFGKAYIYDYLFSVKLNQIYPIFNNILSQIPIIDNKGGNLQPTKVPSISAQDLYVYLLSNCNFSVFLRVNTGFDTAIVPISALDFEDFVDQAGYETVQNLLPYNIYYNLPGSTFSISTILTNAKNTYKNFQYTSHILVDNFGLSSPSSTSTSVNLESCDYVIACSDLAAGDISSDDTANFTAFSVKQKLNQSSAFRNWLNERVGSSATLSDFYLGINLNYTGKYLRKILFGLGYKPSPIDDQVSVLPIVAYFKTWFDLFNPKRDISYEQTNCYKYMDFKSRCNPAPICSPGADTEDWEQYASPGIPVLYFGHILNDLTSCYYSTKHNFVTLCRNINSSGTKFNFAQTINSFNTTPSYQTTYNRFLGAKTDTSNYGSSSYQPNVYMQDTSNSNNLGLISSASTNGAESMNLIQRFTQYIQTKRFVPQSVKDYLMQKYGIDIPNQSYLCGVSVNDLNFDDVFQTATTSEGYLGEYAGRSIGSGSKNISFSTDELSYVICLSVVVPRTQYVDGVNPLLHRLGSLDFYNDEFDGLTMQMIPETEIYNSDEIVNKSIYPSQTGVPVGAPRVFGVAPIYHGYKTSPTGVLNGDLSLRSTRNSFVGFTLDSVISKGDVYLNERAYEPGHISYQFRTNAYASLPTKASQLYRFISPINGLSNLQRIFINGLIQEPFNNSLKNQIIDDTIVLHHVFNFEVNSYMLPRSHSYQTFDLCELENSSTHDTSLN